MIIHYPIAPQRVRECLLGGGDAFDAFNALGTVLATHTHGQVLCVRCAENCLFLWCVIELVYVRVR